MACCRYRVLHQRPDKCQQRAGVLRPGLRGPGAGAGAGDRFCRVWGMFAATAVRIDADDPLSGLELGERPEPAVPDGWTPDFSNSIL